MTTNSADTVRRDVARILDALGAEGFVYGRDIDTGAAFGYRPDELVVTASVFKVPVLVEFCRRVALGELAATERVVVPVPGRTIGGAGLSAMRDPIEISLRDLAYLMMSVSDNHATDVLVDLLGTEQINATAKELGLEHTVVRGTCRLAFEEMRADLGVAELPFEVDEAFEPTPEFAQRLHSHRNAVAATASHTTPREIVSLLTTVWRDEVLPPDACAEIRRLMSMQVWFQGVAFGFPDDRIRVFSKVGSIPFHKSEVAVLEYPDGGRYALGIFLTLPDYASRYPDAYRAFTSIATIVAAHLRSARR